MALKQNTANWVEVRLVDASDAPLTGLAWNGATVLNQFKLHKAGGAPAIWNPASAAAWIESGLGYYMVQLAAGDCDTLGRLVLIATTTTGQPWAANETIEASLPADVKTVADAIKLKTDNLPASPAAVGSNMGTVSNVTGDVQGKVLGGGASAMTAAGVRALDATGAAVAPAATALSTADYTAGRATKLDQLDATVSSRLPTTGYLAPDNATIALTSVAAAAIKVKTDALPPDPADASDVAAAFAAGATATAAVKSDTSAIKAQTDLIPGAPSSETTLAAVKAKTDTLPASPANEATSGAIQGIVAGNAVSLSAIGAQLERGLGLLDENTVRDEIVPNGDGDVVSARIRLFDDDPATGSVIATYAATYTYSAPHVLDTATVARIS
jgi:hypothetical protein